MIFIDFETFWAKGYSVASMATREYVADRLFQDIGIAIQYGLNGERHWFTGDGVRTELRRLATNYPREQYVAHNMRFDGAILKWRYGITPAFYFDTRLMAQARLRPFLKSVSLASVAEHYSLPSKGTGAIDAKGKRFEDFTEQELRVYGDYAKHDVYLCAEIFKRLVKVMPETELRIIDMTLRMYLTPVLSLDPTVLKAGLKAEKHHTSELIKESGIPIAVLRSRPQFCDLLQAYQIPIPMKTSPRTGKPTAALAATDPAMRRLSHHPDVGKFVRARMAATQTLETARLERMISLAHQFPNFSVPVLYYGTHTGRYTGDEKINVLNLPTGKAARNAITAPAGHKIVAIDYSQLELRLSAWWGGETELLDTLRKGKDPYIDFANSINVERKIGKVGMLSLQYFTGAKRFAAMLMASGISPELANHYAEIAVVAYRTKYKGIKKGWTQQGKVVQALYDKIMDLNVAAARGADDFIQEIHLDKGLISLPNGMHLAYPKVEKQKIIGDKLVEFTYQFGDKTRILHGGVLTENWIQALGRIIAFEDMLALRTAAVPVLQLHDENIFVVPTDAVPDFIDYATQIMCRPRDWAPSLPLAVEASYGDTYGECK